MIPNIPLGWVKLCEEHSYSIFDVNDETILYEDAPEGNNSGIHRYNLHLGRQRDRQKYFKFLDHFAPSIIGVRAWKSKRGKEPFEKILTRSDDAFLLVVIDGNYSRWNYEIENPTRDEDDKPVR